VTLNLDFKVTELLLMPSTYCAQFMRDLFAIAKFLFLIPLEFVYQFLCYNVFLQWAANRLALLIGL